MNSINGYLIMTNSLKPLLLKIASLKPCDQQWILQQLPDTLAHKFQQKKGLQHLAMARRFLGLTPCDDLSTVTINPLPDYCHMLAHKAPLYVAIILEQGNYPWEKRFLCQFDEFKTIDDALNRHLADIKPAVKKAVWQEWQHTLSFDQYLENPSSGF